MKDLRWVGLYMDYGRPIKDTQYLGGARILDVVPATALALVPDLEPRTSARQV